MRLLKIRLPPDPVVQLLRDRVALGSLPCAAQGILRASVKRTLPGRRPSV